MDYDLAVTFYVLMLAMATAGTGVAFFSRKSYDLATCCYGIAMLFSICFAMLDWLAPDTIGATVLSTTFDTYIALLMTGMCMLCYKYDMRHKADVNRLLEEAHLENLRQRKELLSGVGVVDIAEGDVVEIMVEAKWLNKEINGLPYSGFTAIAIGTSILDVLHIFGCRGINLYKPEASDYWNITLFVNDSHNDLKDIYHLVGGVWTKD